MNITFRQMKLWLALADQGSVSAAARASHVTQPTASAQLKEITRSVGLPLYEIVSRKVYLTDAGRTLAQTARQILREWENFEQYRHASLGLSQGRLRIAAVSTAEYFIPRLVGQFCQQHPGIDVSLEILNRRGVVERLRENLDELYVMSMPPADQALADQVFMENPLVIIVPSDHALTTTTKLRLANLKSERFILRELGSGTRIATTNHFRKHRFHPQIRLELGSNQAIKEAVAGGLGLGVVSQHSLSAIKGSEDLATLDLPEFPILSRWHLVHPEAKSLSPIAIAFKAFLLKQRLSDPLGR